jgi:hypothetical protein
VSVSRGFLPGMAIEVANPQLYFNETEFGLLNFDILRIQNYQPSMPLKTDIGVGMRFSMKRKHLITSNPYVFEGGAAPILWRV